MSELSIVARKLVEEAKSLNAEIDAVNNPPSRTQIEALQAALNDRSKPTHGAEEREAG